MLNQDEIQALYEEVRPGVDDTFVYSGEQINAILPALSRMDVFSKSKITVLNSPIYSEPVLNDDGVAFEPKRVVTVQLNNAFIPSSDVKIYSIMFAPAVFKENQQDLQCGSYLLPPVTSERDFKLYRNILVRLDMETIMDTRMHGDTIIEPEGKMVDKWEESDRRVLDFKEKLLREFSAKLDQVFDMNIGDFSDQSNTEVDRFGKVFLRVSEDSFVLDSSENALWENNTYFRVAGKKKRQPVAEV